MAQIKTKRNGTIELNTITSQDGREFIPHTELANLIYDTLYGEVNVADIQLVTSGQSVFASCKMTDTKTGRSVVGIGESVPSANESEYEKAHRAFSAANRAFDNAAFLLLGIDRSTLANGKAADAKEAPAPEAKPEPVQAPAPAPSTQKADAPAASGRQTQTIDADNPFDTVIVNGKFKGKTFREAATENPGYAQWVVEKSKMPQEIKDLFAALLQQE